MRLRARRNRRSPSDGEANGHGPGHGRGADGGLGEGAARRGRLPLPRGTLVWLLAGMLVVALPLLYEVVRHRRQLAATNTHVIASGVGVPIAPGENRCQGGEYVPRAASFLRVWPGKSPGGPPLGVRLLTHDGTLVAQTRVPGGYRGRRALFVPLPPRPASLQIGYLCLRNLGRRPVIFAGNLTSDQPQSPGTQNTPYQRPTNEVRADYFYGGRESYLAIAPEIARRATMYAPPFVRPWMLWLSLGVLAALVAAGSVTLTRVLRT